MADNTITITGNVTRDPELRYTPGGQAVATFGVAVNRRWQNRQTSEWEESTSFFDVTCWGSLADNVADSVGKGTRVIVNGRLDQRSWETQDGEKRSKVEIVADEVGPSLRWATAKAEKSNARGSQGGGSDRGPDRGYRGGEDRGYRGDDGGSGGGSGGGRPQGSSAGYSENEEPF